MLRPDLVAVRTPQGRGQPGRDRIHRRGRASPVTFQTEEIQMTSHFVRPRIAVLAGFALVLGAAFGSAAAVAQEGRAAAASTYRDIDASLGLVPGFFKAFPEAGIAGGWAEFKNLQMSETTALPPRIKQLIGLAVSAQVPCAYCVYFHTAVAKAYGASDDEIKEAVAMAAISRHWSTVLNGMAIDLPTFKQEVDASLRIAAERGAKK
jgi:AhpD family alkylhydroperoxidase